LAFKLYLVKFSTGEKKVLYAAMHLKGAAFAWFKPTITEFVDADTPLSDAAVYFRNFAEFEKRLKLVFGIVDEGRAVVRTIYSIR
jgi:hypothetical protein